MGYLQSVDSAIAADRPPSYFRPVPLKTCANTFNSTCMKGSYWLLLLSILWVVSSCSNSDRHIAFPLNEYNPAKPEIEPLKFGEEKQLTWDTVKRERIQPDVKSFDISTLPATGFDSTTFKSFKAPPEVSRFDYNSLPEGELAIDKLPAKPLVMKTSLMAPPDLTYVGKPVSMDDKALDIYKIPFFQGIDGRLLGVVYVDQQGLLWIGGVGGLYRYDGQNIQTIIPANGSIPGIVGLMEDALGRMWFMQINGNLGVVDLKTRTISRSAQIRGVGNNRMQMTKDPDGNIWVFNVKDTALEIIDPLKKTFRSIDKKVLMPADQDLSFTTRSLFHAVHMPDQKVWVSTFVGGVDIIDLQKGTIKYLGKKNGLVTDSIATLTADKKNDLVWLASRPGLDAVDLKKGTITHYGDGQRINYTNTVGVFTDKNENIWRCSVGGIYILDWKNGLTRFIGIEDGLSGIIAVEAVEDKEGHIWLANNPGLNMIDQSGFTAKYFNNKQIISISEDEEHNLWVATNAGMFIVNPERNNARLFDKAHGLSNDFVQAFFKWNGKMVVSTNGGFQIIDPAGKTMWQYTAAQGLLNDTVYTVYHDKRGDTWLTGPSNGIDRLDSVNDLTLHADTRNGLSDALISDVKGAKDGKIWLATGKAGVDVFDPQTGIIKNLRGAPGLRDTCSRVLLEDDFGRMWIGTDKGIYIADTKNNVLTSIGSKQGLSNPRVTSLLAYHGNVLASSGYKVYIINAPPPTDTAGKWSVDVVQNATLLKRPSLTSSWSTDAVTSDGKFLWGDNGISVLNNIVPLNDSATTVITGVNVMTRPVNVRGKGLPTDTLWVENSFYTRNSDLPENLGYTRPGKYKWDSVKGPANLPVNLELPHDENYMQFHFTGASLGRQDTVWYSYILEGVDKQWSLPTTNTSTENYLNLPSGHFTFRVASRMQTGEWSKPASFSFTILPPWYKTWWAYTLYVLVALAMLRIYIAYRSRKLKNENRQLEDKVKQRTEELEQTISELKATQSQLVYAEKMASLGELTAGIAHEIQNPLNFVNNFSEVNRELITELIEEVDKGNANEIREIARDIRVNEEKINYHGKRADSIVKGMLQHSRQTQGELEPTDINALCDEYLRLSYHGMRAKNKDFQADFKTDFDPLIGKINVVPQNIGRVLLNLFNNAFYACADRQKALVANSSDPATAAYHPRVTVTTRKERKDVLIEITDNGKGITSEIKEKIFQPFFTTKPTGEGTGLGLSLSYDIITKEHNGTISVESTPAPPDDMVGGGTLFIIKLPLI